MDVADPAGPVIPTPVEVHDSGTATPPLLLGRIALLAVLNALVWALLVPPWQTPDEPKHFEYARLLAERGELIAFVDEQQAADPELQQAILDSMSAHRFWWLGRAPGYDPALPPQSFADVFVLGQHTALYRSSPLYYALVAAVQPDSLLGGLYAGRLLSVLLAGLTVLVVGLAARALAPADPFVRYGAPTVLALHPMFAFAFAGVNNDVLVNALAAGVFLACAAWIARGPSLARAATIVFFLALGVATKRTALTLLPLVGAALAVRPIVRARRPARRLGLAAVVVALVAAVAAIGLVRVWPSVPEARRFALLRYFFNEPEQPARIAAVLRADGTGAVLLDYLAGMHAGFWGRFGWEVVGWPSWLVGLLALAGLVALAGGLRVAARALRGSEVRALSDSDRDSQADRTSSDDRTSAAGWLAALTGILGVAFAATAFFASYLTLPYGVPPQGRYLFVVAGPIAFALTLGWGAWIPAHRAARWRALVVLTVAFIGFDLLALLGLVVPWFYG